MSRVGWGRVGIGRPALAGQQCLGQGGAMGGRRFGGEVECARLATAGQCNDHDCSSDGMTSKGGRSD